MAKSKSTEVGTISQVLKISTGKFDVCIVGTEGLILNRMAEKAKRELLLPRGGRLTSVEKLSNLKHDPVAEFRSSAHRLSDPSAPTLLALPAVAFKKAMSGAALDLPGMKKAQIGRLTFIEGHQVPIYGVPKLHMSVVRMSDMNKTPDIRTRVIVPKWACRLSVSHVMPLITAQAVANLIAAGGLTQGVGDGRTEKGTFNFGAYRVTDSTDEEFIAITSTGGRAAQMDAMGHYECFDDETVEMLTWYQDELTRRDKAGKAKPTKGDEAAA